MTSSIEKKQYSLKDITVLKSLLKYVKPYLRSFILVVCFDAIVCSSFMLEPLIARALLDYIAQVVDQGLSLNECFGNILLLNLADFSIFFLGGFAIYFVNIKLQRIGQNIIKDMRDALFDHILSFSKKQLSELKIGSYVTRVTNDSQKLSMLFSNILPQLLRAIISIIVIIISIISVSVQSHVYYMPFVYFAYLPIVFLISYFFRKRAKKYYRAEKKSISEMNSFLSETFQGIKVIEAYDKADKKNVEFDSKNGDIRDAFLHSQHLFSFYHPFMYFLQVSCVILIVAIAIPNIDILRTGVGISIGTFQILYSYSLQFFSPIQNLANMLNQIENIITSAERIHIVLDQKIEIEDQEDSLEVESIEGRVEFKDVCFSYIQGQEILHHVSFVIEPGEMVAFVGATGAGKSTIISLITRTYEVDSGDILIDGISIKRYSISSLRKAIGVMLQDVFLFSGTVKDNITLEDDSYSKEEVEEVVKYVGASSFISKLDNGYDTEVKERGANFSSGQRQLLSFARTLLYKPSMILLDEATANIDTETEKVIQHSIENIKKIGTMIIVAHRLSTIKDCDKIFVIDKGVIAESGSHQQLLKNKGIYYKLYELQNMERKLEDKQV